jgi:hypothetical protein
MINGIYGYLFGNDSSEENVTQSSADVNNADRKAEEQDWILVDEARSGRSSPVVVAEPELEELESNVSSCADERRKEQEMKKHEKEEKRKAIRMALQERQFIAMKMFEESTGPSTTTSANSFGLDSAGNTPPSPPAPLNKLTASKLKRAGRAEIVQNEAKVKNRSKKNGKISAGRNNDRKCNNIN